MSDGGCAEPAIAREVAALLSYLRSSWGNDAESVDGEEVQEVREEFGARTRP